MTRVLVALLLGAVITWLSAWGIAVFAPFAPTTYERRDGTPNAAWTPPVDAPITAHVGMRAATTHWQLSDDDASPSFFTNVHQQGWPARAFESRRVYDMATNSALSSTFDQGLAIPDRMREWAMATGFVYLSTVPLRPLAVGFAVNTIVWGGVLLILQAWGRQLRRAWRRRRNLCESCAYPQTGDVCPECGRARAGEPALRPSRAATYLLIGLGVSLLVAFGGIFTPARRHAAAYGPHGEGLDALTSITIPEDWLSPTWLIESDSLFDRRARAVRRRVATRHRGVALDLLFPGLGEHRRRAAANRGRVALHRAGRRNRPGHRDRRLSRLAVAGGIRRGTRPGV